MGLCLLSLYEKISHEHPDLVLFTDYFLTDPTSQAASQCLCCSLTQSAHRFGRFRSNGYMVAKSL